MHTGTDWFPPVPDASPAGAGDVAISCCPRTVSACGRCIAPVCGRCTVFACCPRTVSVCGRTTGDAAGLMTGFSSAADAFAAMRLGPKYSRSAISMAPSTLRCCICSFFVRTGFSYSLAFVSGSAANSFICLSCGALPARIPDNSPRWRIVSSCSARVAATYRRLLHDRCPTDIFSPTGQTEVPRQTPALSCRIPEAP